MLYCSDKRNALYVIFQVYVKPITVIFYSKYSMLQCYKHAAIIFSVLYAVVKQACSGSILQ